MKENQPGVFSLLFDCILGIVSVSKRKKRTPARSHTYRSQKGEERKKLVSPHQWAPPPHTLFLSHLQRKEKWAWFESAAQHIRLQPPAPFDEAGPGQEHRWIQGRGKTSVFMVERVLSIWASLSTEGFCTWELNALSVWSHFLRLTDRKVPQPNSLFSLSSWQNKKTPKSTAPFHLVCLFQSRVLKMKN